MYKIGRFFLVHVFFLPVKMYRIMHGTQVRRNVLDVQYHVSQYQAIISELRTEIGRLKDKLSLDENRNASSRLAAKSRADELKSMRDEIVENFNEQMKLRFVLTKITLALSGWNRLKNLIPCKL